MHDGLNRAEATAGHRTKDLTTMHYQHYDDDENHYYCNNHDYYRHCCRLLLVVVRHDRNKRANRSPQTAEVCSHWVAKPPHEPVPVQAGVVHVV